MTAEVPMNIHLNVTAKIATHALELAHRWQVDDVVDMVEKVLIGLLTESTFDEIASRSQSQFSYTFEIEAEV